MSCEDDVRKVALGEMRRILGRFVRGESEPVEFISTNGKLFAPFDPPDLTIDDLSEQERNELVLFIEFYGGWFGESEDKVPRRESWAYGRDLEPYAWVDAPAFRAWIMQAPEDAGISLE